MKIRLFAIIAAVCVFAVTAHAQRVQTPDQFWQEIEKLSWQFNGSGKVGNEASITVSNGYAFLNSQGARRFLELQGNPPRDNRYIIAPKNLHWFGVFLFEPIGYVKDDESIDPDALLQTLKEQNRAGLDERKRQGLPALYLDGWFVPPHYDIQTKRLEYGTKLHDDTNEITVNYVIKILGRGGVMDALLVSSPNSLEADTREFKAVLSNFSFDAGQRYSEFRSGDKVAEYGLAALVVGGAAAAAMKSGALKGMMKFLWVGVLGIGAVFWSFIKKMFGGKERV